VYKANPKGEKEMKDDDGIIDELGGAGGGYFHRHARCGWRERFNRL